MSGRRGGCGILDSADASRRWRTLCARCRNQLMTYEYWGAYSHLRRQCCHCLAVGSHPRRFFKREMPHNCTTQHNSIRWFYFPPCEYTRSSADIALQTLTPPFPFPDQRNPPSSLYLPLPSYTRLNTHLRFSSSSL